MLKSPTAFGSKRALHPSVPASSKAAQCQAVNNSSSRSQKCHHQLPVPVNSEAPGSKLACRAAGKGFGKVVEKAQPVDRGEPCPCNSGKAWKYCCLPRINGTTPATTAEQTLRARFSSYVKGFPDYLVATTHVDYHAYHYQVEAGTTCDDKLAADIATGVNKFEYAGLKVLKAEPGATPEEASIEYEYLSRPREAVSISDATATDAPASTTDAAAVTDAEGSSSSSSKGVGPWSRTAEKDKFKKVDGGKGWQLAEYQVYTMPDQSSSELVAQAELTSVTPAPSQVKARTALAKAAGLF